MKKSIDAVKMLGVDMINQANSGHPGIVLGAADMAYYLFNHVMNINPKNPNWINRDRFVLSAGHGSALLYSLLHLTGFDLTIEDLKEFRKVGKTPGHPEYGHTVGVETTSGPLGQGIANAVGMAISEMHLESIYNKENFNIIDHYIYTICGDGDLQEGVAQEAISLAGRLRLKKLIVLYDSNDIQLDGSTELACNTNYKMKFLSENWNYILVPDGQNKEMILEAIKEAKLQDRPTLIEVKTIIGRGTNKQGTSKVHGSPLGREEREVLANNLEWTHSPFIVPEEVYNDFEQNIIKRGREENLKHDELLNNYQEAYPKLYKQLQDLLTHNIKFPLNELKELNKDETMATRKSSGIVLDYLSKLNKQIIGGSADLVSSTMVKGQDGNFDVDNRQGRNINYGVREHAMGSINNGIYLHLNMIPVASGFFVFSDYLKPSIRLSALMQIPTVYVFTHDSVAVGEDGPTHEPVEQLAMLRTIPNMNVVRPADFNETIGAYKIALESRKTPTAIICSRQNLRNYKTTKTDLSKGAYIFKKESYDLKLVIIATGSELEIAYQASLKLEKKGYGVRVVSMPCVELFEKQPKAYRTKILPNIHKTMVVEAASSHTWYKYAIETVCIDKFGLSANGSQVLKEYGFSIDNVYKKGLKLIKYNENFIK